MVRRRYDTEALVGQLKKERRTSMALTVAGVTVVFILVALYFVVGSGGSKKADTSATHTAAAATAKKTPPKATSAPAAAKPAAAPAAAKAAAAKPAPPAKKAPPRPATLHISINRRAFVWLDGKKIGRFRHRSVHLPAGKHVVLTRLGRHRVQQRIKVSGGEKLSLRIDVRHRRAVLKKQ